MSYRGGVGAAQHLLATPLAAGFTTLFIKQRLDLTVEAEIIDHPQWYPLFTALEIETARKRLEEHGYNKGVDISKRV